MLLLECINSGLLITIKYDKKQHSGKNPHKPHYLPDQVFPTIELHQQTSLSENSGLAYVLADSELYSKYIISLHSLIVICLS